jgi:hypothetical protein
MKNINKKKKTKLWNKWNFIGNKTKYAVCLKMVLISLLPKYLKWTSKGIFLHAVTYTTVHCLKVKAVFMIARWHVMTDSEVFLDDHLDNVKCAGFWKFLRIQSYLAAGQCTEADKNN